MLDIFDRPRPDPVDLPMTDGPWPALAIVGIYLIVVLKLGRQFMADREPYDLRRVLKIYNLLQVVYNGVMFLAICSLLFGTDNYNISCLLVLPVNHQVKPIERAICYGYYLNKILDLLDTVFIVLRKSYRQITFLHLIHHSSMVLAVYGGLRFHGYGGHFAIMGLFNSFVHVLMYTYYYMASQSEAVKQNRGYKQYITIVQMVQFTIVMLHSVWTLMQPDCDVPILAIAACILMGSLFMIMFGNFYLQTYILPKKKTKQT